MSNVEKEYQKRFADKQESSTEIESEGLWNAINLEVQPEKKKRRKYIIWLFTGIMVIMGATLLWNTIHKSTPIIPNGDTPKETHISTSENLASKETINNKTEGQPTPFAGEKITSKTSRTNVSESNTILYPNEKSSTTKSKHTIVDQSLETINTRVVANLNSDSQDNITNQINSHQSIDSDPNAIIHQDYEIIGSSTTKKKNETSILKTKESNPLKEIETKHKSETFNILPISTLATSPIENHRTQISHTPSFIPIQLESKNNDEHATEQVNSNTTIDFYAGFNYINHNYSSKNNAVDLLQNESENTLAGNTIGLSVSKPIYNNISGSVGLEYSNLWTKTIIDIKKDSSQLLPNHLIKIIVNNQTQDTIELRKDTTVYAVYTREIAHHNNTKTISFPLSIGYHHNINRFDLGINVGMIYSIRTTQSGKGYNNLGEIFEYDKDSPTLPLKKFSLAFRLSPLIRYKFNDNYSIIFSPQYQFSSGSHYDDSNVSVRSSLWNINVGIGKRF